MDIKRIVKKYIVEIIILIILFGLILVLIFFISGSSKKKNLFMCYDDKSKIPQKVYDNLRKYAKEYNIKIYDDKEIIQFFKDHYSDSDRYINKFNTFAGAHKADFWRYCVLYHYGGVYLDIKTELIKPINEIFVDDNILYTCLSAEHCCKIHQALISTPPKNPIFLDLIEHMLNIGEKYDFHAFIIYFYDKINEYCNGIKSGFNRNLKNDIDIYLFTEGCTNTTDGIYMKSNLWNIDENKINKKKCKSVDKYGLCCYVYDNKTPIIKTRFDDFGKTW